MKRKTILILGIEVIILIILYLFIYSGYQELIPQCWIRKNTGIFCPACGGTSCVIFLLQGNWIQAFFSHMIFLIGIVYLLILNILLLVNLNKKKKIAIWLYPKPWYAIIFAIVLLGYTIIRNLL